ncbi:hypothetical protein [Alteromonas sp. H39]|uniref:hypothetical protein n=1 Tax=Alteromonas sp. H39 TaxID=3389876 RepID=UPI0039E09C77
MDLEEKCIALEARINALETKLQITSEVEKHNRRWGLAIIAVVCGILGVSAYELPGYIAEKSEDIVNTSINEEVKPQFDQKIETLLSDLLERAEEEGAKINNVGAKASEALAKIQSLKAKAEKIIALQHDYEELSDAVVEMPESWSPEEQQAGEPEGPVQWVTLFSGYYAKEGYTLSFGEGYKLSVNNVQPNSVKFQIVSQDGSLSQEYSLSVGDDIIIDTGLNKTHYKITLIKVDEAGFNIFKKAAFFKVQQSQ